MTTHVGPSGETPEPARMGPREAARLLTQTQADARRALEFRAPWVSLVAAMVALVGFGIVWLNVRDQRPFTGPSLASLAVFYVLIALRIATVIYAYARARTGVSGRSVKVQRDEAVVICGVLLVCYLALIAIASSGSHGAGFYWSLFLNGTLIALAVVWAGRCAIHNRWHEVALTVAVALIAALAAMAGPRGMWLVNGVGLCVLLLANAALGAARRRATQTYTVRMGA
jgi:fucose 4-O-acetylase-like acetyltransferase